MPNSKQSSAVVVSVVQKPALKPPPPSGVDYVLKLFGPDVFMVPFEHGQKRPQKGFKWKDATLARTQEPVWRAVLAESTIAIRVGPESGNLIAIDFDDDDHITTFVADNKWIENTTRSRGMRGCQFWLRMTGPYPELTAKFKDEDGRDAYEWRAGGGGLSTIYGQHPSGEHYERIVDCPPLEAKFEDIVWHEGWQVPMMKTPESELEARTGPPCAFDKNNKPTSLNQNFFATKYKLENDVLYDDCYKQFYAYDEGTGLWLPNPAERVRASVKTSLEEFLVNMAKQQTDLDNRAQVMKGGSLITQAFVESTTKMVKDSVTSRESLFTQRPTHLHFKNCMVEIDPPTFEVKPFSREYYSRNSCPITYDPKAECPQFIEKLLRPALGQDDIELLQAWFGQALFGYNLHQVLLVLEGTPGGGKSTLVNVISHIIGDHNIAALQTELLSDHFTVGLFANKTLLYGADVPEDFFSNEDAHNVKSLVGHDPLRGEIKGGGVINGLRGVFNVLCTCNTRLMFKLQNDALAWERRVLIIKFEMPKSLEKIVNFDQQLIAEEGSGIVNWCIAGMKRVFKCAADNKPFPKTEEQAKRVSDLLSESDSVREFLISKVKRSGLAEDHLLSCTLYDYYLKDCASKGWSAVTQETFNKRAHGTMTLVIRAVPSENLKNSEGNRRRGYQNCTWATDEEQAEEQTGDPY